VKTLISIKKMKRKKKRTKGPKRRIWTRRLRAPFLIVTKASPPRLYKILRESIYSEKHQLKTIEQEKKYAPLGPILLSSPSSAHGHRGRVVVIIVEVGLERESGGRDRRVERWWGDK